MTRRASSCSVEFIVTHSAVSPPPTRPADVLDEGDGHGGNHKVRLGKLGGWRSCRYSDSRMGDSINPGKDATVDYSAPDLSRPLTGARSTLILLICINLFNYIDRQVLAA